MSKRLGCLLAVLILAVFGILCARETAWASAVVQKQKALQLQQKQAYEQALRQKTLAKQQAYQQAAQQQSAIQQKQQAYQQAVELRKSQQAAYQEALKNKALEEVAAKQEAAKKLMAGAVTEGQVMQEVVDYASDIQKGTDPQGKDMVDIDQVWKELEISSEIWPLIIDLTPKEITVSRYIDYYETQGVIIRKTPLHYVRMIDAMLDQNKSLLKIPFKYILRTAAIIEYDFDNGEDKDLLARKFLGEKVYQENKKRFEHP
ncbi:MAG TPA: hypothetical protein DD723_00995 [Candidatus Omnitrophica bacterium]|nr:MAG: hypothetical protein A2Z81_02430 [Omnitrophica WOR_2 bacterium GWA2_45_18]HBR14106.1 hypothetical protein [Candidatus Omnitrophota bacterium]